MAAAALMIMLSCAPARANETAEPGPGTPIVAAEIQEPVTTVDPEQPATEEAPIPTADDAGSGDPAPAETVTEESTAAAAETPVDSGTPMPVENGGVPQEEVVIPFDPTLECLPHDGSPAARAGDPAWALLECAVDWETTDIDTVHVRVKPGDAGWTVVLVDDDEPDGSGPETSLPERIASADEELELTPQHGSDDETIPFVSGSFLMATRLGCAAPLSAIADIEMTAHASGPAEPRVERVTMELELDGEHPIQPALHDVVLTFEPIPNVVESRMTTGSLSVNYTGAPARCGWSISLTFTDFVSGNDRVPADLLIATAVSGLKGATVTSDRGVVTIVIPEQDAPRDPDGALQVSLELGLDSFVPGGVYQTAVTASASVSPQGG